MILLIYPYVVLNASSTYNSSEGEHTEFVLDFNSDLPENTAFYGTFNQHTFFQGPLIDTTKKRPSEKDSDTTIRSNSKPVNTDSTNSKKGFIGRFKKRINIDSTRTKPPTVKGTISVVSQYSNNSYLYQSIPESFVRTSIDLTVRIGGLPFNTSYYYTTESGSGFNQINNFRLSFDYQEFHRELEEKVRKKIEANSQNEAKKITGIDILQINNEYDNLVIDITDKKYQRRLSKNTKLLEAAKLDSSILNTYKYKAALEQIQDQKVKTERIAQLDSIKQAFQKYQDMAKLDSRIAISDLNNPKKFNKAIDRYGFLPKNQKAFLSIKKLDIGTVNPAYAELVLNGVSITGFNIEVNPNHFYSAFTIGRVFTTSPNPINVNQNSLLSERRITSGRIGFKSGNKILAAVSVLSGEEQVKSNAAESKKSQPNSNLVIGTDITYQFNEDISFGIEHARSETRVQPVISNEQNNAFENIINFKNQNYSSSWIFKSQINFNEQKTRIKFGYRRIDPYFYTYGSPFIRKDLQRYEVKADQVLFKRQFTGSVTLRRERDNLYETKQGTSFNNSLILTGQIRIKKYPILRVSYSPNFQSLYNAASDSRTLSRVTLLQVMVSYGINKKELSNNFLLSYINQSGRNEFSEFSNYGIRQYMANHTLSVNGIGLQVATNLIYSKPISSNDSSSVYAISINLEKSIFNNKATAIGAYRYQADLSIEQRNIFEIGTRFTLLKSINLELRTEYQTIKREINSPKNDSMFLGRLSIIKLI
ncbi:MAG: hypothetical protein MUE96_08125 [Bacteroidia bacterium]|jgi:hypothetical protein|nr:hypothetical protein [Bacteroidia bacterium]